MIGLSSDDPDLMCPDCKRLMVRLDRYETAIDAHGAEAAGGGFTPVTRMTIGFLMFDWLINALFAWRHRAKSRKLCAEVLPNYPNSMVCAYCLFLYRRR
jgi:hypothetical protein